MSCKGAHEYQDVLYVCWQVEQNALLKFEFFLAIKFLNKCETKALLLEPKWR